ncbi:MULTISPECIES: hypothetical protein [Citrobacter]|nr:MULTISPECIES: hypothetical protein [Citrobacter]MDM3444881.1 hypothetical protein [Citrobacter sp. Cb009]MDV0580593.1 hypothetical protein [Citrobacter braakii]MEB0652296.1 hypothetical protein [Citrobacter braakii]
MTPPDICYLYKRSCLDVIRLAFYLHRLRVLSWTEKYPVVEIE